MSAKCVRGTVLQVNLDPSVGREIAKARPCVVVQNDVGNKYSDITIVAAITGAENVKKVSPICVTVPRGEAGLGKDSIILCNQIRTVDGSHFGTVLGNLRDATMARVDEALKISLGLP